MNDSWTLINDSSLTVELEYSVILMNIWALFTKLDDILSVRKCVMLHKWKNWWFTSCEICTSTRQTGSVVNIHRNMREFCHLLFYSIHFFVNVWMMFVSDIFVSIWIVFKQCSNTKPILLLLVLGSATDRWELSTESQSSRFRTSTWCENLSREGKWFCF